MRISLNWIKDYIPGLTISSIEDLTEKMTAIGLDIESLEYQGAQYDKFVVGKVLEKEKHPNADKLSICKVDIGEKELQIVCGAPNVAAGQKVCVALVGAVVPNGGFEIKKSKIRGESSEGMICSERELNLSESHEGILVLNESAAIGRGFAEQMGLDDYVMDIWVAPNRGDTSSHFGIAREIASIYDLKIKIPEITVNDIGPETKSLIKINIENTEHCKRFTGRVIRNVKIQDSPEWLKQRLLAIGLRPRNNIVDITNFVMMETGQPLHAFDYDKIKGKEIIVKSAMEGDKFVTLDSKERTLNSGSLMVCDKEGYSGIAGIMGGELSEITENTTNVFLESAYFDPVAIRKNSKKLGLMTDASQRFEKGVDINNVVYASNRAAQLMQQLASGEVSKGLVDEYPVPFEALKVGVRAGRASAVIGLNFSKDDIIKLLDKIEVTYSHDDGDYHVFNIPEFRRYDLEREIDLVEEIARMYGYEKMEDEPEARLNLNADTSYGDKTKQINRIREYFIGRGFNEILTRSQQDERLVNYFSQDYVKVENPYSIESNVMRVNLLYGMLTVIRNNINTSGKDISLRLFEIGKVFSLAGKNISENNNICFAVAGKRDIYSFNEPEKSFDIFDIKGELEMFLAKLNLENYGLFYYNSDIPNSSAAIGVGLNNQEVGKLYRVGKELLEIFDIDTNIYLCEMNLDMLIKSMKKGIYYSDISRYPNVKRDLALLIGRDVAFDEIRDVIRKTGSSILKDVKLFDIYTDKKIGEDKKSLAFSLEFSSKEKTLTDEEVNSQVGKIVKSLETKLGATLRS